MIKNIRVSSAAVKEFRRAIYSIECYSPKISKCISWFEACIQYISQSIIEYRTTAEELGKTMNMLGEKKEEVEALIEDLISELNDLECKLEALKEDLDNTPETITVTDDGEEYEEDNPEYEDIEDEIDEIEGEIEEKESRIDSLRQRQNRIYSVMESINAMEAEISESIETFDDIKEECRRYIDEIEDLKSNSIRNSENAEKKTRRIEEIIYEYLRIKMKYENLMQGEEKVFDQRQTGVAKDEEINPTKTFSKEEISAHDIKFDQNGRVVSYDGKSFGGVYNSYDTRLGGTMASDNPILGYYEGERGESKFIPSDRSAEGIAVIGLLKHYNVDGIEYRNAEPDFEVCAEAVVSIDNMTKERENYYDSFGIPQLGNFVQADIACAKMWNQQKREGRTDWDGREVKKYRKKHKFTWHEKSDTKTMVMMRSEINLFFSHSGGCSECRVRDGEASMQVSEEGIFDELSD